MSKKYSDDNVRCMLHLHYNRGASFDTVCTLFLSEGEDTTIVCRILLPPGHHDSRYNDVRNVFFRKYPQQVDIDVCSECNRELERPKGPWAGR